MIFVYENNVNRTYQPCDIRRSLFLHFHIDIYIYIYISTRAATHTTEKHLFFMAAAERCIALHFESLFQGTRFHCHTNRDPPSGVLCLFNMK